MNWLYIVVMGYIVFSAWRGFHKGFLRVAYSLAALFITVVFVAFAVPAVRDFLIEHTVIAEQIEIRSEAYIREQIDRKIEDGTLAENLELPWLAIPEFLQGELESGTKEAIEDVLESQGIYRKIAKAAADFIVSAIAFFLSLAVIQIILIIIGKKLDLFSRVPGVHIVNMILGFCAGVVKAFFVIWIVFALIKASAILPVSAALIDMIEEDAVLKGLYERNWILELGKYFKLLE